MVYEEFIEFAKRKARIYHSMDLYIQSLLAIFGLLFCVDVHQLILDIFNEEHVKRELESVTK